MNTKEESLKTIAAQLKMLNWLIRSPTITSEQLSQVTKKLQELIQTLSVD